MTQPPSRPEDKPAPKIAATKTPPAELAKGSEHEERMLDEGLDESFPASDPAASAHPDSTAAQKHTAAHARGTPLPDAANAKKKP